MKKQNLKINIGYDIIFLEVCCMKYVGIKCIETDRLILRKITIEDAYKAFENWCNREM